MCIPEEYNKVIEQLQPVIEAFNLDRVSVESLVRSCVEIEDPPSPPASTIWKDKKGVAYTTKLPNIKIDLRFALETVLGLQPVIRKEDIWMVLAVLNIVVRLFCEMTEKIDDFSSLVLVAVYRLRYADAEKIRNYVKTIDLDKDRKISDDILAETLTKLEKLGCIRLENGGFVLNETINGSMLRDVDQI